MKTEIIGVYPVDAYEPCHLVELLIKDYKGAIDIGDLRIAFCFHYLAFDRPLITPAGEIPVPAATDRPRRLDFLHYESQC